MKIGDVVQLTGPVSFGAYLSAATAQRIVGRRRYYS
ncbi:MAG: hypothetical protein KatS3mg015_2897 [Fimbriimonadales bacterium]|nr:MAG: hypothetical protein KatS3mg015_2897 [Fimbriimonadales bacterium]